MCAQGSKSIGGKQVSARGRKTKKREEKSEKRTRPVAKATQKKERGGRTKTRGHNLNLFKGVIWTRQCVATGRILGKCLNKQGKIEIKGMGVSTKGGGCWHRKLPVGGVNKRERT